MKTTSSRSFPIYNNSLSTLEPLRIDSSSMVYSSGSQSFENQIVVVTRNRDNNLCNYRHPNLSVERMSMSDKNPTHRFCNCVDFLVSIIFFSRVVYYVELEVMKQWR